MDDTLAERDGAHPGDAQESGALSRIAFVGDSITASGHWADWFPRHATINLGTSGDRTDDVLARLDDIISAQPDEISLLIGTNDLGAHASVEHTVRNIQLLLVSLRRELPGVRLLLQSIMPRGREFSDDVQEANIHLRQFAATVHAQYLDLWPALADENGAIRSEFSEDALHLNDDGYRAWLEELRPALEELRDEPPMSRPLRTIRVGR
ncbi:MAG: hypothetical protein KF801_05480 [Cryobacterium sp.]|nr:hypothetical protein [Cryobacterium sp.]